MLSGLVTSKVFETSQVLAEGIDSFESSQVLAVLAGIARFLNSN